MLFRSSERLEITEGGTALATDLTTTSVRSVPAPHEDSLTLMDRTAGRARRGPAPLNLEVRLSFPAPSLRTADDVKTGARVRV